jgi:hypothetical protein
MGRSFFRAVAMPESHPRISANGGFSLFRNWQMR